MSEKKKLHSKWKALCEFRLNGLSHVFTENEELMYKIEFKKVRAKCLRLSRKLYAQCVADVESRIRHHVKSFWAFVNKFKRSNSLPEYMRLRDR